MQMANQFTFYKKKMYRETNLFVKQEAEGFEFHFGKKLTNSIGAVKLRTLCGKSDILDFFYQNFKMTDKIMSPKEI